MPLKKNKKKCSEPNSPFNNFWDYYGTSFMSKLPEDRTKLGTCFGSTISILMWTILIFYGIM